jgi:hypothetical protein
LFLGPVALQWFWQTEGRSTERVILGVRPSEFILSEFQSHSRRIFIGSHSLPPLWSPNRSFSGKRPGCARPALPGQRRPVWSCWGPRPSSSSPPSPPGLPRPRLLAEVGSLPLGPLHPRPLVAPQSFASTESHRRGREAGLGRSCELWTGTCPACPQPTQRRPRRWRWGGARDGSQQATRGRGPPGGGVGVIRWLPTRMQSAAQNFSMIQRRRR